ncbi:TPA: DUF2612 domain-containing protein [Enterobacter asburiae]|uniref:DUF2612 domain-containing protein n=1 Tax=Enterobacter asburiae TaxID=61645 RepID=UPI002163872E|nr:DUF2612 domain-containing protein [Enterobacter asburiae]MCS0625119.1 DUF2612 domain-containing protein [Enterobacter asburiae]HDR2366047.1 DUF2612 domain-containing protein [Enterobacter asburiae]
MAPGYTDLITNYHATKPKFFDHVDLSTRPLIDITGATRGLVSAFDIDTAVGVQLDTLGLWIGRSRIVSQPIQENGVNFRSITDVVDLRTASGRYNFRNILSAAQYESDLNSERTLAGLAVARAKGRVGGRRPKFTDEQWREMGERMATGESRQSVSKTYGVGLSTLYKKFPAS